MTRALDLEAAMRGASFTPREAEALKVAIDARTKRTARAGLEQEILELPVSAFAVQRLRGMVREALAEQASRALAAIYSVRRQTDLTGAQIGILEEAEHQIRQALLADQEEDQQ